MKRYIVIGCGRFGSNVARTLSSLGNEVLAVDIDNKKLLEIADDVTYGMQADITDENALKDLDGESFDVAIVCISSNYKASIMATLMVKELGVKNVIAKALDIFHGKALTKIGADKIIYPERDMGIRLAHNLVSSNILDFIELSPDYSILGIKALDQWSNKTLKDLKLPSKYGINVMAIKHGKDINISPYADDIILKNDTLVVIGNILDIKKVDQSAGE